MAIISLIFPAPALLLLQPPLELGRWGDQRSEALAILEGRYARGEIQRDEYLQKKQDLGGGLKPSRRR